MSRGVMCSPGILKKQRKSKGRKVFKVKKLTRSEYFKLNAVQKILYNIYLFFCAIPPILASIGKAIWGGIKGFCKGIKNEIVDTVKTFGKGTWQTKVSYLIMGFGNLSRGQIFRGLMFLVLEVVFIFYMITNGVYWLGKFRTLGDVPPGEAYDPVLDAYIRVDGDNSFTILLYGLLTMIFIVAFVVAWRMSIKQSKQLDELVAKGKKIPKAKDDIRELLDHQFHKTLLAIPLTGIICFTVLPIIFMIFVAFTNYGRELDGYANLFTWVGFDNFKALFGGADNTSNLPYAFGQILKWTLTWAVFATFSNYFLGMLVAILINKKGIKLKKLWRGILVLTIAIPQFVSLLYVGKMFDKNGLINGFLVNSGLVEHAIDFWGTPEIGRVLIILINIWIGIPYLMLMATGILMNIPEDLYESSRIDGANAVQQFTKITLPYMLFITGPYLLTSFIGNINNFNVIYLLTGGAVTNPKLTTTGLAAGSATDYDLLVTWLFKITTGAESNYKLAAVLAIMIFVVVSVLSVIVYNVMPSNKNEEDFQ